MMAEDSSTKEINGKAVIASGNVGFTCAFGSNPIKVNKVFGLLVKENDQILKFRLIVEQIPPKKKVHGSLHGLRFNLDSDSDNETKNSDVVVQISLIYLSDENIDCRIRHKSANSSDKIINDISIVSFQTKISEVKAGERYPITHFDIDVCKCWPERPWLKIHSNHGFKFNDQSTSDFVVKCKGEMFYVHKSILKDRSEYFNNLLKNECLESKNNELTIEDFSATCVEMVLRYLYNGAVILSDKIGFLCENIAIADKYNLSELHYSLDSCLAQNILIYNQSYEVLKNRVKFANNFRAPKAAAAISHWKMKNKDKCDITDEQWSTLVKSYPNFAVLSTQTLGRKDYQTWMQQHDYWSLSFINLSIIVGPSGEMKGAVKCAPV